MRRAGIQSPYYILEPEASAGKTNAEEKGVQGAGQEGREGRV